MDPNKEQAAENEQVETDEVSVEEKALAAFDEGVAEAEPEAPAPKEPKDEDDGGAGGGEEADAGDDEGDGEGGQAPAGDPEETDEQRAEREKAERDTAAKAEDDTAVKELGLRGKAEQRFRDLSGQVRELRGQLETAGGEEVLKTIVELGGKEGLERTVRDARDQQQWDEELRKIECTPQQFGQAIGYIAAINSNDPTTLRQAREGMLKEIALLDERLGEKTDRHDPLAAHADLKAKVQKGEIDEEDALEIVRLRRNAQQSEEQGRNQTQKQQAEQAQRQGLESLRDLGNELARRDGAAMFKAKMDAVRGAIDAALPALPPDQWRDHAIRLYEGVKVAPVQQRPRIGKQPVRQSHDTSGAPPRTDAPKNPYDAFDQGIEEAREMGL